MPILNFGSLNIDHVYRVDSFVQPGETKHSKAYMVNSGGKGLNQSIAAAKAGGQVLHAGLVGRDGSFLVEKLQAAGVDTALMQASDEVSGHAIIQVADSGQNCILLYGGTNQLLTESYVESALSAFGGEGLVLLQNETNLTALIIQKAAEKGLKVAFNAAPYSDAVNSYPINLLDWLIVNEVEAAESLVPTRTNSCSRALRNAIRGLAYYLRLAQLARGAARMVILPALAAARCRRSIRLPPGTPSPAIFYRAYCKVQAQPRHCAWQLPPRRCACSALERLIPSPTARRWSRR